MIGVPQAARIAGIALVDYERPAGGVLVASGCGLMMAVMDAAPCLRWCVDIDRVSDDRALGFLLRLLDGEASPLAVCGWFSITDPERLRVHLRDLRASPITYGGNVRLGPDEPASLTAFLARLQRIPAHPSEPPRLRVHVSRAL